MDLQRQQSYLPETSIRQARAVVSLCYYFFEEEKALDAEALKPESTRARLSQADNNSNRRALSACNHKHSVFVCHNHNGGGRCAIGVDPGTLTQVHGVHQQLKASQSA